MSDIVERLRAPAYWISGSSEGHEGDNSAPLEAADEIDRLRAALKNLFLTTRCDKTASKLRGILGLTEEPPHD